VLRQLIQLPFCPFGTLPVDKHNHLEENRVVFAGFFGQHTFISALDRQYSWKIRPLQKIRLLEIRHQAIPWGGGLPFCRTILNGMAFAILKKPK